MYRSNLIAIHADYRKGPPAINDIAVLKLVKRVPLSEKVKVVCLPDSNDYERIFNKIVTAVGWYNNFNSNHRLLLIIISFFERGKINDGYSHSVNLHQTKLKIYNQDRRTCSRNTSQLYCAKDAETSKNSNSCNGDLGDY
jgi:hypothetical protein